MIFPQCHSSLENMTIGGSYLEVSFLTRSIVRQWSLESHIWFNARNCEGDNLEKKFLSTYTNILYLHRSKLGNGPKLFNET